MSSSLVVPVDAAVLAALAGGDWAEVVALAADGELGPDLALVGLLGSVDPQALAGNSRVDLLRAIERCRAMLDGAQQRVLGAVVEATEGLGLTAEEARHEVGAALRLAPSTAGDRTLVAIELRDRLPATLALLRAGDIAYLQAAHMATAVRDLPDELAVAVQHRVLPGAPAQTLGQFKGSVARAVLAVDPASAAERHQKAVAARTIGRMPQPDGMQLTWVTMPASVADHLWDRLTRDAKAAQALRGELGLPDPGLDALRVDALAHAVLGTGGADPAAPTITIDPSADHSPAEPAAPESGSQRMPPCSCGGAQTAAVVVDLPTLLGLAENPGRLPGYGPIPAPLARAMAADRDWIRWLVDPQTGQLLDLGAERYRPCDRLRRFIAARDRTCGFTGCRQPAQACDCDHIVTFAHHGQTIRVNLGPLCRQHHNAKTHGRWKLSYHPDTATKTWTSPLGKTYTVATDPVLT